MPEHQGLGFLNLAEDWSRLLAGRCLRGAEAYVAGTTVATTPGQVVFRNALIELIQYAPATPSVHPEPVLLVPSWLLKYYILDLSPGNSLVRFLVARGHTVFMISWRNPGRADEGLTLTDYRTLGVQAALESIRAITGDRPIHATGYCLGGTLLAATAAMLARRGQNPLASLTLLATLIDFEGASPGLNPAAIEGVVRLMRLQGHLDSRQIIAPYLMRYGAGTLGPELFRRYVLGDAGGLDDITAWRTDSTRIPWRVHAEVLQRFYGDNEIARGQYRVDGTEISMTDIRAPLFAVAAADDQVAPWRSVRQGLRLFRGKSTFVLAEGSHQSAIVTEPDGTGLYRMIDPSALGPPAEADRWATAGAALTGAWWTPWSAWLSRHSSEPAPPPAMGNAAMGLQPLCAAPGTYVLR